MISLCVWNQRKEARKGGSRMPENRLLRPPGIRINHRVNNSLASGAKQQCTPSTPASHIVKGLTAAGIPSGGRIQREGMHYHMCSKHAAGQCCASMLNEDTAFYGQDRKGPLTLLLPAAALLTG